MSRLTNIVRLYFRKIDEAVESVIAKHEAEIEHEKQNKLMIAEDSKNLMQRMGAFNTQQSYLSQLDGLSNMYHPLGRMGQANSDPLGIIGNASRGEFYKDILSVQPGSLIRIPTP